MERPTARRGRPALGQLRAPTPHRANSTVLHRILTDRGELDEAFTRREAGIRHRPPLRPPAGGRL